MKYIIKMEIKKSSEEQEKKKAPFNPQKLIVHRVPKFNFHPRIFFL